MHDLSLYAMELIENSIRAQAALVAIHIEFDKYADLLKLRVEDDGEGIHTTAEEVFDPFYTTKGSKKVGLGLSLFKEVVELSHGRVTMSRSGKLEGMAVEAVMRLTDVNRPPLGDFATTISTMILANPTVDFHLNVRSGERQYSFRLKEFARNNRLDPGDNIDLAVSAFTALRAEMEAWKRYDLMCSKEKWQAAMNGPALCGNDPELNQGVVA